MTTDIDPPIAILFDAEALQARIQRSPFNRWLGLRVTAVSAEGVEMLVPWREEFIGTPQLGRAGDRVMWGQANAEPLPLTRALMEHRHAIGSFRVFLGVPSSDTCRPEHADCVEFLSYCGTGANRALAQAGKLDILPCHYS